MNTVGTSTIGTSWRLKYFSSKLQSVLRKALVAEKICTVDNSDLKYIANPYSSQVTAAIQAVAGTYSVSAWTITDDNLTVTDEVIYGEHVFDFENIMSNYDLMSNRFDEISYAVAWGIDYFVLNNLTEDATGAYTTPAGGFTAANINEIMSNLLAKVAGFADTYKGLFLVIENTDLPGFVQAHASNGFSFADATLNNGWVTSYMGIDIYVVRTGTFVDGTIGSVSTILNAGHRVFGVKNVATYASPRGIRYDEKGVSGKTGKEISVAGLVGFKLWYQKTALIVDITLA